MSERFPAAATNSTLNEDIALPFWAAVALRGELGTTRYSRITCRIVPALGYVPGNVGVISFRANTIKNNASMREIEQLLEWLRRITPLSNEKPNKIEELVAFA